MQQQAEHYPATFPDDILTGKNSTDFVRDLEREIFVYNEMIGRKLCVETWVEPEVEFLECPDCGGDSNDCEHCLDYNFGCDGDNPSCRFRSHCKTCGDTGEITIKKNVKYGESYLAF